MSHKTDFKKAKSPEDLAQFFVKRANAGDVDGLLALYEEEAVLVINAEGEIAKGKAEIHDFYEKMLRSNPKFEPGTQQPVLRNKDLAMTSSRLTDGSVTAEVARLQPDNTWLWIIDQPAIAVEKRLIFIRQ